MVLQGRPHLAQVHLRSFFEGLQDQRRMGLGSMRVPVPAHRPGCDLALRPIAGVPADRARLAHAEPLRRLPARDTRRDGGDHTLAKILRQSCSHGVPP
jgi:hypothetical protein